MVDALAYNATNVADVPMGLIEATLSDGGFFPIDDEDVAAMKFAVYNAYHHGLTIVTASGNADPGHSGIYPADFERMVVGVGAVGCDGSTPDGFATGTRIDLVAPSTGQGDVGPKSQTVTTAYGNSYRIADNELFGGTSAAAPHVAGIAALAMSHTSTLTNEDVRELMQRTARDLGSSGRDDYYGHGLVRADSVLQALSDYDLVHDATSAIDSWAVVDSCRSQVLRNIMTATGQIFGDSPPANRDVHVYSFETKVPLSENTTSHVPEVWVRGRQSLSARNTSDYDGMLEPYYGEVVSVSADSVLFRGYAYQVFAENCDCDPDSSKGWFPLNLLAPSLNTKFAFSYLADVGSPRSGGGESHGAAVLGVPAGRTLQFEEDGVGIRFYAPERSRAVGLYDVTGRLVSRLEPPEDSPGWTEVVWNGRDGSGRPVASGVYFARIESGHHQATVRVLVLR